MRCAECGLYQPISSDDGECRANPPTSFLVPVQTLSGQSVAFASQFPKIASGAWCGAFEEHEKSEDGEKVVMTGPQ